MEWHSRLVDKLLRTINSNIVVCVSERVCVDGEIGLYWGCRCHVEQPPRKVLKINERRRKKRKRKRKREEEEEGEAEGLFQNACWN